MDVQLREDGIHYELAYKNRKVSFPLASDEKLCKKIYKTEEWSHYVQLEQLWLCDMIQEVAPGSYILPYENISDLNEEEKELMGLELSSVDIAVSEKGNVGSKDYKILWHCEKDGQHLGRIERFGNIIQCGQERFLLTKEQYDLIGYIDRMVMPGTLIDRGKEFAKVKAKANRAQARFAPFTDSRDFYYVNDMELDCSSENDMEVNLHPVLCGLPDKLQKHLQGNMEEVQTVSQDGHRNHIFVEPSVCNSYNAMKSMDKLIGTQVPRFIEQPLSFIQEGVSFDKDLFAKRVKGLKIHKSSAVPYIRVEKSEEEPGWFDVSAGILLRDDSMEENSEEYDRTVDEQNQENLSALDQSELSQLIETVLEQGEEYVYYNNQWVKIDAKQCNQFQEKLHNLDLDMGKNRVPREKLHQILDIYENIDGIEYNETFLENLRSLRERTKEYEVSRLFQGILKSYQLEGYSFLRRQHESGIGAILADDMGLGKTVQVIALLAFLKENDQLTPTLLVVPEVLIDNWVSELGKFLPSVKQVYCYRGKDRYKNAANVSQYEIVITTYETLARDQIELGKVKWQMMICDETQKIKNYRTLLACAVKGMNAKHRIAMTGTPVENRLSELWSITDFVQPGLLQNYAWFRKHYEVPIQSDMDANEDLINELVEKINPIFLRRLKYQVLKDELPTKEEHKLAVELSNMQKQHYEQEISQYQNSKRAIGIINTIQRLIMLSSHPRLLESSLPVNVQSKDLIKESKKLEYTLELLKDIKKKKEKVLIFTKYKKMQMILRKVIYDTFRVDAMIINGDVSKNRMEMINGFNTGKGFDVMILSPKAAGVGLNITGANHVIHYTREWNPAIESQATDRAYRIGQDRMVHVYYPIAVCQGIYSVEEKLDALLEKKKHLMSEVVVPVNMSIRQEELEECLEAG